MLIALSIIFFLGYLFIALESIVKINKAATALITGVVCWVVYILYKGNSDVVIDHLAKHFGNISQILFFLLSAMIIVELIDSHNGFDIITDRIKTKRKRSLLWIISFITFFLSSVLNNLTTAIVMVSLVKRLIPEKKDKLLFAGMIVIAANAGGVWTPIGDVTTTMLWLGGQVTTSVIISRLFLPGIICMVVPLIILSFSMRGTIERTSGMQNNLKLMTSSTEKQLIFYIGTGALVFVPFFKTLTNLPPYMGMLLSLGVMWILTEIIHKKKDDSTRSHLSVASALKKIDTSIVLFFLGILLCIAALESSGLLVYAADFLNKTFANNNITAIILGLFSSVIDNVPLVAASMGMYNIHLYPADSSFWEFLAYTLGTGGSILIIGSAAGIAVMGVEKIDFVWYFKKMSFLALMGYLTGAAVYLLQVMIL
jgi:Na+/H+ antiporter NhaD/arsenite permease-like protein